MRTVQQVNHLSRTRRRAKPRGTSTILVVFSVATILFIFAVIGLLVTTLSFGVAGYYTTVSAQGLARLKAAPILEGLQPTRILDRRGRLILQIPAPGADLYRPVAFVRIPRFMKLAVIASEDKSFYSNPGFDPGAIVRAARDNLRGDGSYTSGASTITQQLVKRLILSSQQTTGRKLQEVLIAYAVSQPKSGFTKNDILNLYLNTVFFGEYATGVEAASRVYFGKDIWHLDLAQCALLAGLVQAPTFDDPILHGPAAALDRLDTHVLPLMNKDGYITRVQMASAIAEARHFVFTAPHLRPTAATSAAPYWTDWILQLLGVNATNPGSYTDPTLAKVVQSAHGLTGLTIRTTLDLALYQQAQQSMRRHVAELTYDNVQDAAVVTLDPASAECLNMVGGLDYHSQATGSQINMAASPRQPGSSFKIFTYATAFERGWYPAKMILDEPQTWPDSSEPSGIYAPKNYDLSWHGAVTIRMALANSFNIPAVKTIAAVGVKPVLHTAIDMGAWYLRNATHVGLSLTLGSKEVPLWQMAQSYNTLANNGVFRPMASVLSIDGPQGKRLYTYHRPVGVQVIAPQYAYLLTSILKDNYARVPAFGANSVLQLGPDSTFSTNWPAAVKTGTTQNFDDNLTIGYTPNLLTATWVGNPDHTSMNNIEGIAGAGPIWHDVMEWSLRHLHLPQRAFMPPPGIMLARVSSSGMLATNYTSWSITDVFASGTLPHLLDNGAPDPFRAYRVLGANFSLDGGNTTSVFGGAIPLGGASSTPGPSSQLKKSGGLLTYNPGSHANVCPGGGSYTYAPIYANGQLSGYRVTCQ